jgi:hypothetical protein
MPTRPRATVLGAVVEGWRRVLRAPLISLGMLAITTAVALPLAVLVARQVQTDLGYSATADRVWQWWDTEWGGEFAAEAQGVAKTLTYEIIGFGATLRTLDEILDGHGPDSAVLLPIAVYAVLWLWFSGGILDRLARGRPVRPGPFFAACGVFFFRFLRVAVIIVPLYAVLFLVIHPLLFETVYAWRIADLASETRALVTRVGLYLVFVLLLMLVSLLSDFAKVRMVVEDRHSAISSVAAGARFIRRRFWRVSWLYVFNILIQVVLARLWLQTAPGSTASVWVALLASQVYLVFRLWARLSFMASEIVFFQGELAHATYAALPEVAWPDSPSIEALRRLDRG